MNPHNGKPSFPLADGSFFTPEDAEWLEHLVRRVFEHEADSMTFCGPEEDEKPFEELGKFIFHLYNQRSADGTSSLEKVGPFGKAAAKLIADVHRSFALGETGVEAEKCAGTAGEQMPPVSLKTKSEIHRAAAKRYPYLFRGGYSPDAPSEELRSRMWKAARMTFRNPKPWGNTAD